LQKGLKQFLKEEDKMDKESKRSETLQDEKPVVRRTAIEGKHQKAS
jgi:hypothetical protein